MSGQDHKWFMTEAIRLAVENVTSGNGGPFGAVVVKAGDIIGRGANQVTTTNDPTAHAEVVAIRDAARTLSAFELAGCEIYSSCEPCPMCLAAIYWARIDRLYFAATKDDAAHAGFDDSLLYQQVALPLERRSLPCSQLMRAEAVKAFDVWAKTPNKIDY